ncbi:hypothetical protein BO94DRAFT_505793 [Aspergillus sclerotioniger CBS 115572]|uniref:Zn(2)-C6 fungal-type domain-containing protein n=1 Tax=Aspergillus sclerotioniger CBS 115572 TaxID=1450535 RepID=A0A317XH93_9EURO|nr:hypothetical protein BO94DRAFT_505793 [Aspergillus sclerotioniger CBS 115572]PWY96490.1 hypothetical protein BO94DRAFT_505793 [Aspergillus sclerotioniger CBS 115572]
MNVRSRTGCLACKKRKRRCGEEKPACRNCVVRGFECPYLSENSQSITVRFKISLSNGARLPVEKQSRRHFLTISSGDVSLLSSEHNQEDTPAKIDDTRTKAIPDCFNPVRLEASIFATPLVDCTGLEEQLFQYYLQVICRVRVFRDDPRNKFRSLVVPFCRGRRPLLYAVLSVSANDRRTETVATHINYEQLALSYKYLALKSLRKSLSDVSNASEALMTCLILCTLEIASGCQPDWVRHVQGAFAIINSCSSMIDPEILFFARSYFQSRAIFFRTTGSHNTSDKDPDPLANLQPNINHCMDLFSQTPCLNTKYTDEQTKIQPHIGCSLSLLDIIARATDLVSQKQQLRQTGTSSFFSEGEMLQRVISLRSELDSLPKEYSPDSEYLTTCGQCFRLAADLYLQLACDIPLSQPTLQTMLGKLLDYIGQVIREDQERQLFPMWPLFLAGCLSTSDYDRVRVLNYFTYLSYSWPVSNVAIVREATETVWKFRDLNPHDCGSGCGFDWQMIINRMNWKLALS